MSSKDRHLQARGRAARRDKTRSGMVAALASLLVSMGGCDAGSNGGPDDSATGGPPTPNEPPPSIGEVLVTVKVQDPFGAPVPGAQIRLLRSDGSGVSQSVYLADQDGRAEIATDSLTHGALVSAPDMESAVYESTRQGDDRLEITVTLHPSSAPAGGVGAVSVISSSRDGRELSVSGRLYVVDGNDARVPGDWQVGNVRVRPCEPDVGSDANDLRGRLCGGPAGLRRLPCCWTRVPASRSPTRRCARRSAMIP